MMWIEWKNSLINLRHVKSIYWTKEHWGEKQTWSLVILMNDKEGKYAADFESEEEVRDEFERIKRYLEDVVEKR
jgi:hypothetical protein